MSGVSRALLGLLFVLAGINHFVHPAFYESIVPPSFPSPARLVQISGVAEIAGGIGVWVPATRRAAAWGLIALLIAVYPANWNMALHPDRFPSFAPALLWLRLPLQLVLIAWTWRASRPAA